MNFPNIYEPYKEVDREPIQYTYCKDFNHICRYKGLRQVIHEGLSVENRFIALETTNPFETASSIKYYTVPANLENRLDLIAQEQLGSATYAWVIAYINHIADGFTVLEGTVLKIPSSITSLFNKGEILAALPANKLNLGSE